MPSSFAEFWWFTFRASLLMLAINELGPYNSDAFSIQTLVGAFCVTIFVFTPRKLKGSDESKRS